MKITFFVTINVHNTGADPEGGAGYLILFLFLFFWGGNFFCFCFLFLFSFVFGFYFVLHTRLRSTYDINIDI